MKRLFLLLMALMLTTAVQTFAQKAVWAEKIAGTGDDQANSIAVDAQGNTYVAGTFSSATLTLNNGKALSNSGTNDAYIAKYNSAGLCQWAEKIAGTWDDQANSIAVDAQGNTYVAGTFTSSTLTLNNGKTLTNSGSYSDDSFIAKYNSAGLCQWAEKIAGTGTDFAESIAVDASGNVYVAGNFYSPTLTLNNGKTLTNSGSNDAYIAKYNSAGLCQWVEKIAGTSTDYAQSITVDGSGNVYVAGDFTSYILTLNNGKALTNSGETDAYIAKYNSAGLCQWAEKIAGTSYDYANSIAADNNGNVYVAGYSYSIMQQLNNGKTLTILINSRASYIAKYNSAGLCQWAENIATISSSDQVPSIAFDPSGNVYIAGNFSTSTLILNNGKTVSSNSGIRDAYIAKYNSAGLCQWAEKIAGSNYDYANSIVVDQYEFVYVAGYSNSNPINFNNSITLTNSGDNDAFLVKYIPSQCHLTSPFHNETGMPLSSTVLAVQALSNTTNYRIQFSTNEYFSTTIIDTVLSGTSLAVPNLTNLTAYYWRAKAYWANDTTDWSDTWKFTTISAQPKIYVKYNASGLNNGTSWANAFNVLQNALDIALPGDSILVAEGTYKPTMKVDGNTDRHKAFGMKHGVAIYGGFAGAEAYTWQRNPTLNTTILSGDIGVAGDSSDNCYHIFNTASFAQLDTNSKLDGFVITKGYVNEFNPDNKGAAMIFNNNGTPLIRNCKFIQNRTTYRGGAVYNGETSPMFVNCDFEDNTSNNEGGAIYNYYAHNTKFLNCTFNYNRSFSSSGGAVYSHLTENEYFDGCEFNNNQSNSSGGALYVGGTINNCVFNNNKGYSYEMNGGAIYGVGIVTIDSCSFIGNYTSGSYIKGGAVYANSSSTITNSNFTCNYGSGSYTICGGAVYTNSSTVISNNNFTGNYCSSSDNSFGGAVYTKFNAVISNNNFTGNSCSSQSSYGYGSSGGAIYSDANTTVCHNNFTENYCSSQNRSQGAAIYVSGGNNLIKIQNCKIINNYCNGANGKGGGIYSMGNLTLTNTLIHSNSAIFGGGIYQTNNYSSLSSTNSTITNNTSSKGGGIYLVVNSSSNPNTLKNTVVYGNVGTVDGSNLYKESGTLNVYNSCYGNGNGDIFGQIDTASNNINANPIFVDAPNDDYRLLGVSPCVDAGDNTANAELFDIRGEGFPRKLDKTTGLEGTIDIGAYEYKLGYDPATSPALPAPMLLLPADLASAVNTSATFVWNSVLGASSYRLQVSSTQNFSILFANQIEVDTFAVITDLQPYTTYYWRVHSRNVADSSLWSEVRSFVTMMASPVLSSPANLAQNASLSPTLLWNTSINASSYRVQVSTTNTFSTLMINEVLGSTNKYITGLANNTTYFWRVRALAANDSSGWSTVWSFTTVPAPVPASWAVLGNSGNTATIGFLPTGHYKIDARMIKNGDAIGVFYNDNSVQKCGGYFVWDGQQFGIVAWGDDDYTTTIKEGFAINETYVYKIWDSQAQVVYDAAVKYVSGPTAYQHNAMSTVDTVLAITSITQTIPLNQSWNMISAYVTPDIPSYSTIMSPIVSSLQLAKNLAGQVYSPPFQTSLSTWNIYHAYTLRMSQSATLQITGIKIAPEKTPISITSTGTNWIPYFRTSPMPVATALSSISGKYLQVKSITGQVYQPPFFLSLSQLAPNNGYNINMSQTGTLTYPANAVTKSTSTGEVVIREPQVFVRDIQITGKTAVIAMDLQNIEDCDEIGVFTRDGMLVGSSVWQYGMHGVVVWGDDEYTNVKDGASEGEALTVKVWNKATKNIGSINQIALNDMTNNDESIELTYETDAVHLLKGAAELSSNETRIFVSPQPASTELMVKLNVTTENEIGVKLYSQEGKLSLETSTNANGNVLKVNTSNLSSGIYQMILTIDGKTYGERVVIVR